MKFSSLFFLLSALLFAPPSPAATVGVAKDDKVLIKTETQEHLQPGDKFFVIDDNGKRVGLVQIKLVKEQTHRAVALLLKGKALRLARLEKLSSASDKAGSEAAHRARNLERMESARWDSVGYLNHGLSFLFGTTQTSMTVKLPAGTTATMKGGSTQFGLYYQQRLDQDFSGRLGLTMESLKAKGTISTVDCSGFFECNADITYFGIDPLVRLSYYRNQSDFWVGAGMSFLFAMKKSSTAIQQDKISTNLSINLATGIDIHIAHDQFIPVEIAYGYFPGNNTVQIQQWMARLGYGYAF